VAPRHGIEKSTREVGFDEVNPAAHGPLKGEMAPV